MGNSALRDFFRSKWVRLVLVLDAIIILVIIGLAISRITKTATLVLEIVPLDANIAINGKDGYINGTYELTPGDYKIEISHDSLDTKIFNLNINQGEIANVKTYLTNDGNIDWYKQKNNRGSYTRLSEMILDDNKTTDQDNSALQQVKDINGNYENLSTLPIDIVEYEEFDDGRRELTQDITIRGKYDDECSTWLCIEALMYGTDSEEYIKELLYNKGFKAEEYEIHYQIY